MKLMMKILATLVGLLLLMGKVLQAESVWIEGEKPVKSTMNRHPRWYDQVKKDQLSGGDWISNFDAKKPGEAEYSLTIKEGGRYEFWVRANPTLTRILAIGQVPWLVKKPAREVTFHRPDGANLEVTPLDQYGEPVATEKPLKGPRILLRPETLYYLIEI
jgi:hypothetical protein